MKNRRNTAVITAFGITALYVSGCSGSGPEAQPTVTETVTVSRSPEPTVTELPPPTTIGTGTPTPTSSLTPRPDGPPVLGFGEPFNYSDGVTVNVTNLGAGYVDSGAESSGGQVVELQLAITNNTDAAWDPSGAGGTMTYGTEGVTADEVFSYENGWSGGSFTGTLLPGRTATVNTAYAIPDVGLGDLVFEFTPEWGFERGAVIYVSQP